MTPRTSRMESTGFQVIMVAEDRGAARTKMTKANQTSAGEIPRLREFRQKLDELLRSPYEERAERRRELAGQIHGEATPALFLNDVLRQCSTAGGPDGLDVGIDLLSGFDSDLLDVYCNIVSTDRSRWALRLPARHVYDYVLYILLRALARTSLPPETILAALQDCLLAGTDSIREAATHALGDLGGAAAKELLAQAASQDKDPHVRESAREALEDLGN